MAYQSSETTHADRMARERHFLNGELSELLSELPTLHLVPDHAQQGWLLRKRDLLERIERLRASELPTT